MRKYATEEERLAARRESRRKYKSTHPPKRAPYKSVAQEPLPTGQPRYLNWNDYLARTKRSERMNRCRSIASFANGNRFYGLNGPRPDITLTAQDVWSIFEEAKGVCCYCGSLCVEKRPWWNGKWLPWEHIGRRIGSLEHVKPRADGGGNDRENLRWACLWCNVWKHERIPGATDHGAYYPGR